MKTVENSETALVRRYGVRGAKLFARVWFPMLYIWLIALNAGLWVVAPEFTTGWRRILSGCIIGALTVVAASLLARMRLQYLAAINRLENRGTTA
jgi:hypothetical protein